MGHHIRNDRIHYYYLLLLLLSLLLHWCIPFVGISHYGWTFSMKFAAALNVRPSNNRQISKYICCNLVRSERSVVRWVIQRLNTALHNNLPYSKYNFSRRENDVAKQLLYTCIFHLKMHSRGAKSDNIFAGWSWITILWLYRSPLFTRCILHVTFNPRHTQG